MTTGYLIQAVNLYDSISIKTIRAVLGGKVVDSSPQELVVQYTEFSYLVVYRFGALVFFNMSNEEVERELKKIKETLGEGLSLPTTETYQVNVGDFPTRVEFEYAEIKKLSLDYLRMISMTLGQSAALEYFEVRADRMLYDTANFTASLAKNGVVPLQTKRLLKIIGSTAHTRQNILSNLAILDPPDETWKSKEIEKFYREMQSNFDIDVRFRTLDRKLSLVQDNIEILADLTTSRRATLLESMIIVLIALEILMKLF